MGTPDDAGATPTSGATAGSPSQAPECIGNAEYSYESLQGTWDFGWDSWVKRGQVDRDPATGENGSWSIRQSFERQYDVGQSARFSLSVPAGEGVAWITLPITVNECRTRYNVSMEVYGYPAEGAVEANSEVVLYLGAMDPVNRSTLFDAPSSLLFEGPLARPEWQRFGLDATSAPLGKEIYVAVGVHSKAAGAATVFLDAFHVSLVPV